MRKVIPNRTVIPDCRFREISVRCVGMQVDSLDVLYSRMKEAGAIL